VKAGGMRVSKKQEQRSAEKNTKPPGKEKTSCIYHNLSPPPLLLQMNHKIQTAALQVTHQKPQPALEKYVLPK
ncbi:DAPL1 protein, partial [Turnix velox]|nr:DAPL1 protein [Turnix velox]